MRLTPETRRSVIIKTGVDIANVEGLKAINTRRIAEHCPFNSSRSTVRAYFRHKTDLLSAVASHPSAAQSVKNDAAALGLL